MPGSRRGMCSPPVFASSVFSGVEPWRGLPRRRSPAGAASALKLLTDLGPMRRDALARFTREVRLARTIAHPNVCRVFDIGEAEDWHYLSMEYVDGETLASVRERIGRLPPEKASTSPASCAPVLPPPTNMGSCIAISNRRTSCSMVAAASASWTLASRCRPGDRVDRIAGTPAYIAPEQLAGKEPTERSDLFSLGLVIYEIVTGASGRCERLHWCGACRRAMLDPATLSFPSESSPGSLKSFASVSRPIRSERPRSALHVAAQLPGGDAISRSARRWPRPDTRHRGRHAHRAASLAPAAAVAAMGLLTAGLALIGLRGEILTVAPADVPKPPEALAERARELLSHLGGDSKGVDQEFGFETVDDGRGGRTVRFVYRTSSLPLNPFNLLHIVTRSDPPMDVPGMATVTLDTSGRLISFSRIVTSPPRPVRETPWADVFREAHLDFQSFGRVPVG